MGGRREPPRRPRVFEPYRGRGRIMKTRKQRYRVMKRSVRLTAAAAVAAGLAVGPVAAATEAMATTDLNIRSGPGPQYEVLGVISGEDMAMVDGCLAERNWCRVSYEGIEGWSYGAYLTEGAETPVAIVAPETRTIEVVEYDAADETSALAGAGFGTLAGALIAGPAGAALGAVAGAAALDAADPPEATIAYVRDNPVDVVYLDGELVVGAQVPEEVVLTPVPDSAYRYVYINNVPVLVAADTPTIVRVIR
ncbi:DUF1236 domain-containing protein [Rhodobacteraceae bacterium CCMM004]|nr:DUF1236 domain-containing protein [Rhodobacteraceae bacterium CCMM004]